MIVDLCLVELAYFCLLPRIPSFNKRKKENGVIHCFVSAMAVEAVLSNIHKLLALFAHKMALLLKGSFFFKKKFK